MSAYDDEDIEEDLEDEIDEFDDFTEDDDTVTLSEDEALLKAEAMCNENSLYDFYLSEMSK